MKKIISISLIFLHLSMMVKVRPAFSFERPTVALLSIAAHEVPQTVANGLFLILRAELTNSKKITNVERGEIDKVLAEIGLQQTGCTETSCAIKAGEMLGAEKIILGDITKMPAYYLISIRIVDVTMGKIEFEVPPLRAKNEEEFTSISRRIVKAIEEKIQVQPEIIGFTDGNPVIDVGANLGMREGMVFDVIRIKDVIKKEGRVIFKKEEVIGKIRLVAVQEEGAIGEIIKIKEPIEEGDFARPAKVVVVKDVEPPMIVHTPIRVCSEGEPLEVEAEIIDNVKVADASCYFKMEKETKYKKVKLTMKEKDKFQGIISARDVRKGKLNYYLKATDEKGNLAKKDMDGKPFIVKVTKKDRTPPVISHKPPKFTEPGKDVPIIATVKDNVSVKSVAAYFRERKKKQYQSFELNKYAENTFGENIPGKEVTSLGIEYYIEAKDMSGNISRFKDPTNPQQVLVRLAPKKKGRGYLWWIAGGTAIVGGVAAAILLTGEKEKEEEPWEERALPPLPPWP